MKCQSCHSDNEKGAIYCAQCGIKLNEPPLKTKRGSYGLIGGLLGAGLGTIIFPIIGTIIFALVGWFIFASIGDKKDKRMSG